MTIIWYFIPFLYLFAAAIKLRGEAATPGFRIPGGRRAVAVLGVVGVCSRRSPRSVSRSCLPRTTRTGSSPLVKVVGLTAMMVGAGVWVYAKERRRIARQGP